MPVLVRHGWSADEVRAQVHAGRWQRVGRGIVRHNGELTEADRRTLALVHGGPHAVHTSFTSLAEWGLEGWPREAVHILVPRGARVARPPGVAVRVHWTDRWHSRDLQRSRRLHRPAQSAVLAAGGTADPRIGCGVLAAVVQQRLVRPGDVVAAVGESTRIRHRSILLSAAHDMGQGAQALSELDFARLCRLAGLPEPVRQAVRVEPTRRRRYLDVEWRSPRRLVVEVDGAMHLVASRWWADQLRQNELVIAGDRVLRFPSVILRCEPALVVDQLRRALLF